jgi:hypothetical protein
MNYQSILEDLIFSWIILLPEDDILQIKSYQDIDACINEEAENEMKEEMWKLLKDNIKYSAILERLKNYSNVFDSDDSKSEGFNSDSSNSC